MFLWPAIKTMKTMTQIKVIRIPADRFGIQQLHPSFGLQPSFDCERPLSLRWRRRLRLGRFVQRHKDDEDDDADQGHQDQVSDRSHDTISGSFSALAISCTTKSLMRMLAKCASIASWPIMSSGNGRSICLRPACRTALTGAAVDRG